MRMLNGCERFRWSAMPCLTAFGAHLSRICCLVRWRTSTTRCWTGASASVRTWARSPTTCPSRPRLRRSGPSACRPPPRVRARIAPLNRSLHQVPRSWPCSTVYAANQQGCAFMRALTAKVMSRTCACMSRVLYARSMSCKQASTIASTLHAIRSSGRGVGFVVQRLLERAPCKLFSACAAMFQVRAPDNPRHGHLWPGLSSVEGEGEEETPLAKAPAAEGASVLERRLLDWHFANLEFANAAAAARAEPAHLGPGRPQRDAGRAHLPAGCALAPPGTSISTLQAAGKCFSPREMIGVAVIISGVQVSRLGELF